MAMCCMTGCASAAWSGHTHHDNSIHLLLIGDEHVASLCFLLQDYLEVWVLLFFLFLFFECIAFICRKLHSTSYSACTNPSLIHHHWWEHGAADFLLSVAPLPRGRLMVVWLSSYFSSAVVSHMIKLNEKLDDLTLRSLNIGSFVTSPSSPWWNQINLLP